MLSTSSCHVYEVLLKKYEQDIRLIPGSGGQTILMRSKQMKKLLEHQKQRLRAGASKEGREESFVCEAQLFVCAKAWITGKSSVVSSVRCNDGVLLSDPDIGHNQAKGSRTTSMSHLSITECRREC